TVTTQQVLPPSTQTHTHPNTQSEHSQFLHPHTHTHTPTHIAYICIQHMHTYKHTHTHACMHWRPHTHKTPLLALPFCIFWIYAENSVCVCVFECVCQRTGFGNTLRATCNL